MKAIVIFLIVCSVAAKPPDCARQPKQLICATNGRITKYFRNSCAFERARKENPAWRRTFPAACANGGPNPPGCSDECNFPCTKQYDPVCGYDGKNYKTYGNECIFRQADCQAGGALILVDDKCCNIQTDPHFG